MGSKENPMERQRGSNWYTESIDPQFKSRRMHRRETERVKQNDR